MCIWKPRLTSIMSKQCVIQTRHGCSAKFEETMTCASLSTSSAGRILIGFSISICNPAFAISTSIALAAMSRDPAQPHRGRIQNEEDISYADSLFLWQHLFPCFVLQCKHVGFEDPRGEPGRRNRLKSVTVYSGWHPNNDTIWLCSGLQHALMVFECLASLPLLGKWSLLIFLDAFLHARRGALTTHRGATGGHPGRHVEVTWITPVTYLSY